MCHPYIGSATALSDYYIDDEEPQEFPIFVGRLNGLPVLSCTQKCKCRLEIRCSVLVSICVWHPLESGEVMA